MNSRISTVTALSLSLLTLACESSDKNYVLVHGAWNGAWVWDQVAADLREDGANVTAVSLPGHGPASTAPAELSLSSYVNEVIRVIDEREEQDEPVILVGHSMAGIVISQVAEQRPDAIDKLVYVAAYLPANGQSLLDLASHDMQAITGQHLVFHEDGTVGIEQSALAAVFCADCGSDALATLQANYRPEPAAPLGEPVSLSEERFGSVPRMYIKTMGDQAVSPALQDEMLAATPVERVIELNTSHSPMLAAPGELSRALSSL